ncbi:MAG TPA: HAD-IA family hydrolase [bacterium]|nr:HAD-IA family hydrolase [bacterium]
MNSSLKAVLFDLDGTLVDSEKDIAEAANFTREYYGLKRVSDSTIAQYVGNGVLVLLEKSLEMSDPAKIQEAYKIFQGHYRIHYADYTKPFPGAFELLNALKKKNVKMGVVSNKPQEFTDSVLKQLDLAPYFEVAFGPEATIHRKPHPEPLLTALQKLGAQTHEAVMIGDSYVDIQAAKAAEMRVGVLTHGYGTREVLSSANPDWMVDSLQELIPILV